MIQESHFLYLIIDLSCIFIPFIASFYKPVPFYKEWKWVFPAILVVGTFFIIWDIIFTKLGVWSFNSTYVVGAFIYNLPLEEIIFFIAIPYSSIFTYFAIRHLFKYDPLSNISKLISYVLLFLFLYLAIAKIDKLYTFVTCIIASALMIFILLRNISIKYIYFSYILIFPFFLISNSILTGTFLKSPIVSYNNEENLGIRIITIPVEDSIYGFVLIIANILLYNYFKSRDFSKKR